MLREIRINDIVTVYQAKRAMLNATVIDCGDSVVVVDTLHLPEDSRELKEKLGGKPVRYLINTHWHSDHCYGNRFLRDETTTIIAHGDYMETITSERNVIAPNARSILDRKNLVFPDICYFASIQIERPISISILHTPGHTMDSSVVYLPEGKILIAGDTILTGPGDKVAVPYFYWGDSDIYQLSLEKLGWLDIDTIVPGHGEAVEASYVQNHTSYLRSLKKQFKEYIANEKPINVDPDELSQKIIRAIPQESCVPGTVSEDFWVPVMHELNIRKLVSETM